MRHSERGNAVMFILLAVALFAGLAFTFMRGARTGTGSLSATQAKLAAQEILDYAKSVEAAVNKLRNRGCSENQLSFDYDIPGTTGYENVNAPSDERCHIFSSKGGQVTWQTPNLSWLISTTEAAALLYAGEDYGVYNFPPNVCVRNPGAPACDNSIQRKDLVLGLKNLKTEVCKALITASRSGMTYNPGATLNSPAGDYARFKGVWTSTGVYSSGQMDYQTVGCVNSQRTGNTFVYVLISR